MPSPSQLLSWSLLTLLAAGCTNTDPRLKGAGATERGPAGTVAYQVTIEASEPGVRIEADGDSVGTAPLTLKIFGDRDGTFHNFGNPDYVIRAYPATPGKPVQTKSYGTGAWFGREDRIPSKIFFQMDLANDGTGAAPRPTPVTVQ